MPNVMPILTIFVPEYCANCRSTYGPGNFKFTLVGTENRCVWLCNKCFKRLHAQAMKEIHETQELDANDGPAQRHNARIVVQAVSKGKTFLEHLDAGEKQ